VDITPVSTLMAIFGFIALVANLTCLRLLWPLRCSRNDVISNVGVILAAGAVWLTGRGWPDITIGLIVAALFLRSAISVLREAWPQFRGHPA
jgi:Co/Zn/Cd efflux system component